jgi:hypothetical protein
VTVADALYAIETDDGVLIQIRNKGLRRGPPDVMARLAAGKTSIRPNTISAPCPNSSRRWASTNG